MTFIHDPGPKRVQNLRVHLTPAPNGKPHIFEDPCEREEVEIDYIARRKSWSFAVVPAPLDPPEYLPPISWYRIRVMELLEARDKK